MALEVQIMPFERSEAIDTPIQEQYSALAALSDELATAIAGMSDFWRETFKERANEGRDAILAIGQKALISDPDPYEDEKRMDESRLKRLKRLKPFIAVAQAKRQEMAALVDVDRLQLESDVATQIEFILQSTQSVIRQTLRSAMLAAQLEQLNCSSSAAANAQQERTPSDWLAEMTTSVQELVKAAKVNANTLLREANLRLDAAVSLKKAHTQIAFDEAFRLARIPKPHA